MSRKKIPKGNSSKGKDREVREDIQEQTRKDLEKEWMNNVFKETEEDLEENDDIGTQIPVSAPKEEEWDDIQKRQKEALRELIEFMEKKLQKKREELHGIEKMETEERRAKEKGDVTELHHPWHGRLHFGSCHHDECLVHYGAKTNNSWFPKFHRPIYWTSVDGKTEPKEDLEDEPLN
jgi:hypothetical protein